MEITVEKTITETIDLSNLSEEVWEQIVKFVFDDCHIILSKDSITIAGDSFNSSTSFDFIEEVEGFNETYPEEDIVDLINLFKKAIEILETQ